MLEYRKQIFLASPLRQKPVVPISVCSVCGKPSVMTQLIVVNNSDQDMDIRDCEVKSMEYCAEHEPKK